eukprot:COSAG02_NODE_60536_length_271_cov_0.598837_2_plen_38_part_01
MGQPVLPSNNEPRRGGGRKSSYMLKQPGHFTSMKNELG